MPEYAWSIQLVSTNSVTVTFKAKLIAAANIIKTACLYIEPNDRHTNNSLDFKDGFEY